MIPLRKKPWLSCFLAWYRYWLELFLIVFVSWPSITGHSQIIWCSGIAEIAPQCGHGFGSWPAVIWVLAGGQSPAAAADACFSFSTRRRSFSPAARTPSAAAPSPRRPRRRTRSLFARTTLRSRKPFSLSLSTGRLILQIHDELLFEVGAGHAAELRALVRDAMEGAYADRMRVPLKVQLRQGPSWGELEKVDA